MTKVSFTKVESILTETLRKMMIEKLSELAAIVSLAQESQNKIPQETVNKILKKFREELGKFKTTEPQFYAKLNLSPEEELFFLNEEKELDNEKWAKIQQLKEKIEETKRELMGKEAPKEEYETQVEKERAKHINKRFNIRDGWLPLQ